MNHLKAAVLEHGAIPICLVDGEVMTKHSKETGRFGHLVDNDKEYAWHVTEWAWPEKEETK